MGPDGSPASRSPSPRTSTGVSHEVNGSIAWYTGYIRKSIIRRAPIIPAVIHMAHNVYYVNKRRTRTPSRGPDIPATSPSAPGGRTTPQAPSFLETGRALTGARTTS